MIIWRNEKRSTYRLHLFLGALIAQAKTSSKLSDLVRNHLTAFVVWTLFLMAVDMRNRPQSRQQRDVLSRNSTLSCSMDSVHDTSLLRRLHRSTSMLAPKTKNVEMSVFPLCCLCLQHVSYAVGRLGNHLLIILRRVILSRGSAKHWPIFRPPFTPPETLCTSSIFPSPSL